MIISGQNLPEHVCQTCTFGEGNKENILTIIAFQLIFPLPQECIILRAFIQARKQ